MNIKKIIENSKFHGKLGSDVKRTHEHVLLKLVEEIGELSLEIQIRRGTSYKSEGADGISGEAVDIIISALDMFYLENSHLSDDEIESKLKSMMETKIQKWKRVTNKTMDRT